MNERQKRTQIVANEKDRHRQTDKSPARPHAAANLGSEPVTPSSPPLPLYLLINLTNNSCCLAPSGDILSETLWVKASPQGRVLWEIQGAHCSRI